jgi:hypothetical protein
VENDISDRQIWLCLRITMGCFAFLSVPVGFYPCDPLKLQVQILSISLSKSKPTQPIPFDKCPAPTHTLRHPICTAPCSDPARPYSASPARWRHARCSYPRTELCASLCSHRNRSHLLLTHGSGSSQYCVVELRPRCGGFTPLLPIAYFPREGKHIATGGVEV